MVRKPKEPLLGRLAFRVEGNNWTAYYAQPGTMQDAIWLGSIRMLFVRDPARKQAFMDLMRDGLADVLPVETWNEPVDAPEHEKSGRA